MMAKAMNKKPPIVVTGSAISAVSAVAMVVAIS